MYWISYGMSSGYGSTDALSWSYWERDLSIPAIGVGKVCKISPSPQIHMIAFCKFQDLIIQ